MHIIIYLKYELASHALVLGHLPVKRDFSFLDLDVTMSSLLISLPLSLSPSQGAKRIVSEWVVLDTEARQFTSRILGEENETQETASPANHAEASTSESAQEDMAEL